MSARRALLAMLMVATTLMTSALAASQATASSVRSATLGADITADFTASPARYEPGRLTTIAISGTLTVAAQRDVVCHSLDTRVLIGRVELDGSLDTTDREVLSMGESHSESVAIDVEVYAPDRGALTVRVSLQCSPVSPSGDWSIPEATTEVIWTGRIQPTAAGLSVAPAVVFPHAEEFDSRARISATAARGPLTVTVSMGSRQVWSTTTVKSRLSAVVPPSRLTRSGTYTVRVKGGDSAQFIVHAGWAPLHDSDIAAWPRCSTISWTYDDAGAPSGGDTRLVDDLRTVFDRYAVITGLRFVEGGDDITVGWTDLPRGVNAEAGAARVSQSLSEGFLRLSRTADRPRIPGFGASGRGVTLFHEIGHVLGLGHVSDRSMLMYPTLLAGVPLTPQRGDIRGLRELYPPSSCS